MAFSGIVPGRQGGFKATRAWGGWQASLEPALNGTPANTTAESHAILAGANQEGNIMSKQPTLIAFAARQRGGQQAAVRARIGAAWAHHRDVGMSGGAS